MTLIDIFVSQSIINIYYIHMAHEDDQLRAEMRHVHPNCAAYITMWSWFERLGLLPVGEHCLHSAVSDEVWEWRPHPTRSISAASQAENMKSKMKRGSGGDRKITGIVLVRPLADFLPFSTNFRPLWDRYESAKIMWRTTFYNFL